MLLNTASQSSTHVDFDLHGLVGVRLIDPTPSDVVAVEKQLGLAQTELLREPDVTLRFVKRLPTSSPLRYVNLGETGFTRDAFVVFRGKDQARKGVQIPFEQLGGLCELVCESGLSEVPLLVAIINLTALVNGALPLHASAFVFHNTGVLATGWSKGGKTETLLGFAAHGARYIGDDWVYLCEGGQTMCGMPEPLTTWDWHLRQLPGLRAKVSSRQRRRLWMLRQLSGAISTTQGTGIHGNGNMNRLLDLVKRQQFVKLPPQHVFGPQWGELQAPIDCVFFVGCHEAAEIEAEPVEPDEVAARMAFSLEEERSRILSYYRSFRFAFPHKCNTWLERAAAMERERLATFLKGKTAYAVRHPYPFCLEDLRRAVEPYIAAASTARPHHLELTEAEL